jgi:hypothetical protein
MKPSFKGGVIEKIIAKLEQILETDLSNGKMAAYMRIRCWFELEFPKDTLHTKKSYTSIRIYHIVDLIAADIAVSTVLLDRVHPNSAIVVFTQMQHDTMKQFELLLAEMFLSEAKFRSQILEMYVP